jgi:hypothetical protein
VSPYRGNLPVCDKTQPSPFRWRLHTVSAPLLVCVHYMCMAGAIAQCVPGCAHVAPSATFAAGMEDCFQRSESCQEYVACAHKIQAAHGQPISGSCELADAGAP